MPNTLSGIIGDRSLSLRLASNNNHSDDFKKQLRSDIANIVRSYEKAKTNVNIAVLKENLERIYRGQKSYVMTAMKSLIKSTHLTDNLYKRQDDWEQVEVMLIHEENLCNIN